MRDDCLEHVISTERITYAGTPQRIPSESNDVWLLGDVYVRVCWRGDRARLLREAAVVEELPLEVGYPKVLAVGRDADISWMVTRAIDGVPVRTIFDDLDADQRYGVGFRLGSLLRMVHAQIPPEGLDQRPGIDIVGEDALPLPVRRARALLHDVAAAQSLDGALVDRVAKRFDDLEPLDPFVAAGTLLHCDAGIENLLWHEGQVVALIDFEWARSGEPWVDVLGYTQYLDTDFARGVRAAYPQPFEVEFADERLLLLELASTLRTLKLWPGPRNEARLRELAS